ncbi:CG1146, partial [Drosophila busckii]
IMDYKLYLDIVCQWLNYLSYFMVAYVLLTLLPKSLMRMKHFADADYEANRRKFHPCYGPELCCHALAQGQDMPVKQKHRKAVTRVYPKRQQPQQTPVQLLQSSNPVPKRSNVTKIARMFESNSPRQVNRVAPVTLPEIRMFGATSEESNDSTPCASRKASIATPLTAHHIEQAMQLWQELEEEQQSDKQLNDWEPIAVPVTNVRHSRGTSATPSTASPLSSSPEPPSPMLLRQPPALCLKSSMEDIFQAIARSAEESIDCSSLTPVPVTSIDDIISERRFSRPLSAYSITDLLNEEQEQPSYINETT